MLEFPLAEWLNDVCTPAWGDEEHGYVCSLTSERLNTHCTEEHYNRHQEQREEAPLCMGDTKQHDTRLHNWCSTVCKLSPHGVVRPVWMECALQYEQQRRKEITLGGPARTQIGRRFFFCFTPDCISPIHTLYTRTISACYFWLSVAVWFAWVCACTCHAL